MTGRSDGGAGPPSGPTTGVGAVLDKPVALHVDGLHKTHGHGTGEVHAVRGASFEVRDGEFVAIVGPSGSGKTTLLAMIGGLLTPTRGNITVRDHELTTLSRRELARFRRDRIGFVFQAGNLLNHLTVLENAEVMRAITGRTEVGERARTLVNELGLADRADAIAVELSAGERQRVAIARALANDPDFALVDEPTSNLDSERGRHVVDTLRKEAHDRQIAVVMVTHDLDMARQADRVLEMRDGTLR